MEGLIYIFGHGDTTEQGIPNASRMKQYIEGEIFEINRRRYHHTYGVEGARIILLAQDRKMYGYFLIGGKSDIDFLDRSQYRKVKHVYTVEYSVLFNKPVPLGTKALYQRVTPDELKSFERQAGGMQIFGEVSTASGESK